MRIPKSIDVFGKKWSVKVLPKNHFEDLEDGDEIDAGRCIEEKFLIEINSDQSKDDLDHTFLHECFHALYFRIGVNQGLPLSINEMISDANATFLLENFDIKPKKPRK